MSFSLHLGVIGHWCTASYDYDIQDLYIYIYIYDLDMIVSVPVVALHITLPRFYQGLWITRPWPVTFMIKIVFTRFTYKLVAI